MRELIELRLCDIKYAESFTKHINNYNVYRNFRDAFPKPYKIEDAYDFLSNCAQKENPENFIIDYKGECIGEIGFSISTDVERFSAEIGYWIGESFWNKGIMTNVLKKFSDYVFNNTSIQRLYANVFESNPSSMKVLEKAGFTRVGIMKRAIYKDDKFMDLYH